ncbi:hypothetical protein Tco_0404510 [Tanacetum coccineum]
MVLWNCCCSCSFLWWSFDVDDYSLTWKLAVKAMEVSREGYLEDAAESYLVETSFQELCVLVSSFLKLAPEFWLCQSHVVAHVTG